MLITVDANDKPEHIRLAASFLLHLVGDISDAPEVPDSDAPIAHTGSDMSPPPPPPPPAPLENFTPPPPPPASAGIAAAPAAPPAPPVESAAAATTVVAVEAPEFDSAGLPWDGRIHQARKGLKKDGTWKIQKGADAALVESVIKELVTRKGVPTPAAATGSAPPPPPAPPVTLPAGQVSLPLPPVEPASNVSIVIPAAAAPVPVPAAPAVGPLPASGFRELIAKISAGTKANKLDPVKVSTIVQRHGCPSLQALRDMPHLIPLVETDIDVEVLS